MSVSPRTSLKLRLLPAALGVRVALHRLGLCESRAAAELRAEVLQFTSSPFPLIARLKLA